MPEWDGRDPELQSVLDGEQASRLLSEPLITGALQKLRDETVNVWRSSDVGDSAGRERCFYLMKSIDFIESTLEGAKRKGENVAARNRHEERAEEFAAEIQKEKHVE